MKKPFKTLAALLPTITLISNLSPVEAQKEFNTIENFISRYVPNSQKKLRRIHRIALEEAQRLRQRMTEEGLGEREAELQILEDRLEAEEAELQRIEEYKQDVIEELEDISVISNNYSYDFTFRIPREPITREEIACTADNVLQNIRLLEAELFPTGQNKFTFGKFKVLALVRVLENFHYNNMHDLSRLEAIQLLCIMDPETPGTIEADTVTVSYYRNKLKAIFSLEGTVKHIFTLIIIR